MKPVIKYFGNLFEVTVVGLLAALIAAVFVGGVIAPDILDHCRDFPPRGTNCCAKVAVTNEVEAIKYALAQKASFSTVESGSKVFEAYGRLVTTVVSLITVLGVFFVYFSRKSHRELEEEVRSHIEREMTKIEAIKFEVEAKVKEVDELKTDCNELFSQLDEYHKNDDRLRQRKRPPSSQDVANDVDAELESEGV
jgi:hypothetical protein